MPEEGRTKPGRRATVARHGQLSSPSVARQLLAFLGAAIAVVLVSGVSIGGFALWHSAWSLENNAIEIGAGSLPPSIGEIEGGANILLVGTDSCEGQSLEQFARCGIDDDGGERNDVTMLVNISESPRRVTVVSFPRDMIVPIPECPDGKGGFHPSMNGMPINASYGNGGLACTALTVEKLTGITVQFAGAIRWTGVINLSDAIGGVDVCVAGDISDSHTGLQLSAGTHTLQGAQALQFLRIRHGIGDGSDLGRISNQQQFMSSLVRKLKADETLGDAGRLFSLATTTMQQVTQGQLVLDTNLADPVRMVQIAMAVKDVPENEIVFVQYPTEYAEGGKRVLPVTSAADVLFDAIKANQPLQLTGEASQGHGVEVEGEASSPEQTPGEEGQTPEEPGSDQTPGLPEPGESPVALPSEIAGTNANQVTCTVPEGRGF